MMKLLGISCGRTMGNSEILLKHALKAAEETGKAEVSFVRLQEYRILPCDGCELCTILRNQGKPLRCKHSPEDDDFFQLIDQVKACDGLIIAAPAYHLLPPGILTVFLNRVHCAGFYNGSPINEGRSRVCASIGVGGTDWTNLLLPIMNLTGTELCGSKMNLIDQMIAQDAPASGSIAAYPAALERAALLGRRMADAMGTPNEEVKYLGDMQETCPICHSNMLEVRGNRVYCPICNIRGTVNTTEEAVEIHWEQDKSQSRFSPYGAEEHRVHREGTRERIAQNQDKITALKSAWESYLEPIHPARGCKD